jgi:hypothetical protein
MSPFLFAVFGVLIPMRAVPDVVPLFIFAVVAALGAILLAILRDRRMVHRRPAYLRTRAKSRAASAFIDPQTRPPALCGLQCGDDVIAATIQSTAVAFADTKRYPAFTVVLLSARVPWTRLDRDQRRSELTRIGAALERVTGSPQFALRVGNDSVWTPKDH